LHHGDYSGEVEISLPTWVGDPEVENFTWAGEDFHTARLRVPFAALEAFVLTKMRRERITALEEMSDSDFKDMLMTIWDIEMLEGRAAESELCLATDGRYGVCNLPKHADAQHKETLEDGSVWAAWRQVTKDPKRVDKYRTPEERRAIQDKEGS
jgi:hypothetical protein